MIKLCTYVLVVLACTGVAQADVPRFQFYELGHLSSFPATEATDINNQGTITGYSLYKLDEGFGGRGILWNNGVMTNIGIDLPEELGYFSSAWGISENNVVVGGGPGPNIDTDFPVALLWDRGVISLWPLAKGCWQQQLPYGINSSGTLGVGYCRDFSGIEKPTVYLASSHETMNLGVPDWLPPEFYTRGFAVDANIHGQVVGFYYYGVQGDVYGFTWSDGVMAPFTPLPECGWQAAIAINDSGMMILGTENCGDVRFKDGWYQDLGPGSAKTGALNERGDSVGFDIIDLSATHPALYLGTGEYADLIGYMPEDYYASVATAINDYRWIVGWSWGDDDYVIQYSWVLVPINSKGDFDGDEDVDLHDFGHFQRCFAAEPYQGPEGGLHVGCSVFDFDDDIDLDGEDYAAFQTAFTGAITSGWE